MEERLLEGVLKAHMEGNIRFCFPYKSNIHVVPQRIQKDIKNSVQKRKVFPTSTLRLTLQTQLTFSVSSSAGSHHSPE